eukprot:CAMPEP_0117586666 /NCGR_PEP_ID=MMETSP0784-20121206/68848_1 /TAXON_ID=39447 /ORGANISM="" /LENGTH=33 /DNA_ID= /DNA_START= /DNA_END= /DNA_ORIENTATION=
MTAPRAPPPAENSTTSRRVSSKRGTAFSTHAGL